MEEKLNFKVQQIQFALFPINLNLFNIDKAKIASDLRVKTGIFDIDPNIMSLPEEAPIAIPRIILQSRDGIFRCDIAISRIDFFFKGNEDKRLGDLKEDLLSKIKPIYSYFIEDLKYYHLPIGRIGFVVDFIADLSEEESATKILQEQFLNKNNYFVKDFIKEVKTDNISLVFTQKDKINGLEINRLIRIDSLRKTVTPFDDKKLALKYDINTIPEKINEYNLSVENVEKILNIAFEEMSSDLNKFIYSN